MLNDKAEALLVEMLVVVELTHESVSGSVARSEYCCAIVVQALILEQENSQNKIAEDIQVCN
jgi:hypothetical protein